MATLLAYLKALLVAVGLIESAVKEVQAEERDQKVKEGEDHAKQTKDTSGLDSAL